DLVPGGGVQGRGAGPRREVVAIGESGDVTDIGQGPRGPSRRSEGGPLASVSRTCRPVTPARRHGWRSSRQPPLPTHPGPAGRSPRPAPKHADPPQDIAPARVSRANTWPF